MSDRPKATAEMPVELMKAFGIPEHAISFRIDAMYGELVKVSCEYYPTLEPDANGELVRALAEYELAKREA